jgi:wyosine [tRNA(Phe)-imidazoG37] synthetase (radical SAM superfamily)
MISASIDLKENQGTMVYQHIFGPVPSRRLGLSLGVDLMRHKTCSLDCVYCECGKTTLLTLTPKEYVPLASIKQELTSFLSASPKLDFITFSGSGEPTLHSGIGEVASFIKTNFPQYKLALLTNGTLLYLEDVRRRLLSIDVVIVSVDAATREAFRKVNRPHPKLTLEEIEAGLISFRKVFKNSLWAEVFLVPGCNTSQEELSGIRKILQRFRPDKIQVNTLDRPGTEGWVAPLDQKQLTWAASFLQASDPMPPPSGMFSLGGGDDPSGRLLAALRRRPLTLEDISRMLSIDASEARGCLDEMLREKTVKRVSMPRGTFYMADTV